MLFASGLLIDNVTIYNIQAPPLWLASQSTVSQSDQTLRQFLPSGFHSDGHLTVRVRKTLCNNPCQYNKFSIIILESNVYYSIPCKLRADLTRVKFLVS